METTLFLYATPLRLLANEKKLKKTEVFSGLYAKPVLCRNDYCSVLVFDFRRS